jgi:hypothetical protein
VVCQSMSFDYSALRSEGDERIALSLTTLWCAPRTMESKPDRRTGSALKAECSNEWVSSTLLSAMEGEPTGSVGAISKVAGA